MGVEVEEARALHADKVVRGAGAAACDADTLRAGEGAGEGGVVDGVDVVYAEAGAEED